MPHTEIMETVHHNPKGKASTMKSVELEKSKAKQIYLKEMCKARDNGAPVESRFLGALRGGYLFKGFFFTTVRLNCWKVPVK